MSTFTVIVERVLIYCHPQADRLEIAQVGDYQSVVGKGTFQTNDLVAYIPEQALVPQNLLAEMGLEGRLAGKDKNRVKAVRLRGVVSQGLCYPAREEWQEGADVTEALGITKWEPPIPTHLAGEVFNAGQNRTLKYDIENYRRFPDVLQDGEPVVFTEKLHGCLHENSLVTMPDGNERTIAEVVADETIDSVWSYNEDTDGYVVRPITGRMRRANSEEKKWVRLTMENGRELVLTEDHPVYSRDRKD